MSLTVLCGVSIFLVSCATTNLASTTTELLTARLLDKSAIKLDYGTKWTDNPYLEPAGIVTGQKQEFAIIELRFALPSPRQVSISASLEDQNGQSVADFYNRDALHHFWATWDELGNSSARDAKIDNACLDSTSIRVPKWNKSYYVVFIGKNPIPRPAVAKIQVQIEGEDTREFRFELPDLPIKK